MVIKTFKKGLAGVLLLFISVSYLRAQQYSFINYSIENGLAQSQVQYIFQDQKGYLWFATYGGLTKYDGKNFVNYSKEDGLFDNKINYILQDKAGMIWFGTQGGINRFDGKSFSGFRLTSSLANNQVLSMAIDDKEQLWLATDGGGVCRFNGESFTYYNEKNGLVNNSVRSVCVAADGKVWFGSRNGACFFDGKGFSMPDTSAAHPVNISQVMKDKRNNLWFTTYGEGVYRYNGKSFINYNESKGLIYDWIRAVTEDKEGNLWFASKIGVSKFNGGFLNFTTQNGLFYPNINTLMQDKEGNMWFGTDAQGALRFTGETFVSYTTSEGLSSNIIMSVNEDKDKNLWFSTYGGGVCRYDGKAMQCYTIKEGLANNIVWTIMTDREGNVLFGTSEGVSKFSGNKFSVFAGAEELGANKVYSLLQDHLGRMWVGTTAGVTMFNGKDFINYSYEKNEMGKNVWGIMEDGKNNLWFCTSNGMFHYDGIRFSSYTTASGLPDNSVVSVVEDAIGGIWAGTASGLAYMKKDSFATVPIDEKYNSNSVNFLVMDGNQHLWVGSNNGIYELDVTRFHRTGKAVFSHYSNYEGLRSLECNQNAGFKDGSGNLWFGTAEGVLRYGGAGQVATDDSGEPRTHITGVRLFLQPADWSKFPGKVDAATGLPTGLQVDYKKNYFTFDYIGISLSNPADVRYRFILDGFDQDWSPPTDATFATYSNLPYGKYTFRVMACGKNKQWNKIPVEFSFEILPPFWMTWWFYLLCFVFLTVMVLVIYRWRVAVLRRRHETQQLEYRSKLLALEQQTLNASMNRHFIFNALNSIQYYINKQDKLSANKYLSSFAKLIRKNLDSSQSNLVPLSEEMERLKLYLELEHMRFENKFEYRISIDEKIDTETVDIPPMLLQPFVENSIWHGILPLEKPGIIEISVNQGSDGNIMFVIEDNGIGIEASMSNKGKNGQLHISRGMEITSGRINLLRTMNNSNISIRGPFNRENGPNSGPGTRVEIILPSKNYL